LPQLLLVPLVRNKWMWQSGLAGAICSSLAYVAAVVGLYRLALRTMPRRWAAIASAGLALNPSVLYLATTPMSESLAIALTVWIVLATCALGSALAPDALRQPAPAQFAGLGLLLCAATLTRFDGWLLGLCVWCLITFQWLRVRPLRRSVLAGYLWMCCLALAGPLAWLGYNRIYFHDWLSFQRGAGSPQAIYRLSHPPGATPYVGFHAPFTALVNYASAVVGTAGAWQIGWMLLLAAIAGSGLAARRTREFAMLLLWLPLPFYAWSIAYGWIPLFARFTPSGMVAGGNVRYAVFLLPAIAISIAFACSQMESAVAVHRRTLARWMTPAATCFLVANAAILAVRVPAALRGAIGQSLRRSIVQRALTAQFAQLPAGEPIMVRRWSSDAMAAALQQSGIAYGQTLDWTAGPRWDGASSAPAQYAFLVVAVDGDPIAAAVKAHPEGLRQVAAICPQTGPRHGSCIRVYRSTLSPPG
jgi:hypothetical protein